MHADQVDLFAPEPHPVTDLRSAVAWPITSSSAEYGWWVRTSWCGRFTICWDEHTARFVAFRRNIVGDRWNPPTWCDGFKTLQEAFEACALYAERES